MKLHLFKHFNNLDITATSLLTLLAIYNNQVTIFYILYLFWWNEVIYTAVTFYYKKRSGFVIGLGSKLFLLGIYWFFIVLFFGFIAPHQNYNLVALNFEVIFFKNLFFNLNLLFFGGELIWLYYNNPDLIEKSTIHPFSARAVILHISIILGAIMMMMVVPSFSNFFTPDNNWSSIVIILPFILLRYFFQRSSLL
ncbi:hypothetical protein [Flavobacterium sp.]|uniref:hypothetical protein n=1 Tax=Flavobacterium sp. TaxID=239 RepID=UPI0035284C0E